eukprot:tig00020943_g16253.t1
MPALVRPADAASMASAAAPQPPVLSAVKGKTDSGLFSLVIPQESELAEIGQPSKDIRPVPSSSAAPAPYSELRINEPSPADYCRDLVLALTSDFPRDRLHKIIKRFYEVFVDKQKLMVSESCFRDEYIVNLLLVALKCKFGPEWIADVMALLKLFARHDENCFSIGGDSDNCVLIMRLMRENITDVNLLEHGMGLFKNMMHIAIVRDHFKTDGIVELALEIMQQHASSLELVKICLIVLTGTVDEYPIELGHDAVVKVIATMQANLMDPEITYWGVGVLHRYSKGGNLATCSYANKDFVAEKGGVALILSVMNAHATSLKIVSKSIECLHSLSFCPVVRATLRHYDGTNMVEEARKIHGGDAKFAQIATEFIDEMKSYESSDLAADASKKRT